MYPLCMLRSIGKYCIGVREPRKVKDVILHMGAYMNHTYRGAREGHSAKVLYVKRMRTAKAPVVEALQV